MEIYRVHVSLREIQPLIWRRIELFPTTTLKQFHRILQIAMGWENYHLHEYIVEGRRYGTPDPTYDGPGEVIRESGMRWRACCHTKEQRSFTSTTSAIIGNMIFVWKASSRLNRAFGIRA